MPFAPLRGPGEVQVVRALARHHEGHVSCSEVEPWTMVCRRRTPGRRPDPEALRWDGDVPRRHDTTMMITEELFELPGTGCLAVEEWVVGRRTRRAGR